MSGKIVENNKNYYCILYSSFFDFKVIKFSRVKLLWSAVRVEKYEQSQIFLSLSSIFFYPNALKFQACLSDSNFSLFLTLSRLLITHGFLRYKMHFWKFSVSLGDFILSFRVTLWFFIPDWRVIFFWNTSVILYQFDEDENSTLLLSCHLGRKPRWILDY